MVRQSLKAFTIIELTVIVVAVGLIGAVTIPHYVHARTWKVQNSCINNLRAIDEAKQDWAVDYKANLEANPSRQDLRLYLRRTREGHLPFCPQDQNVKFDSSYKINNLTTAPACQINSSNHMLF